MSRSLIVLLVLCVFAAAMVPRDKRALSTDHKELPQSQSTTTSEPSMECAKQTPCGWSFYRPQTIYIEMYIANRYCLCPSQQECVVTEDDPSINAYVHRCREPAASTTSTVGGLKSGSSD